MAAFGEKVWRCVFARNVIQGFYARIQPEWTTVSPMVKHGLVRFVDRALLPMFRVFGRLTQPGSWTEPLSQFSGQFSGSLGVLPMEKRKAKKLSAQIPLSSFPEFESLYFGQ